MHPISVCVESVGAYAPRELLKEALGVLVSKARDLAAALDSTLASDGGGIMQASDAARASLAAMTVQPDMLV